MSICEHLDAYCDGELSHLENERFAAHLLECEACRMVAESWAFVEETVLDTITKDKNPFPAPSHQTAARIEAAFACQADAYQANATTQPTVDTPMGPRNPYRYWPFAVAAIIVFGLAVGFWFQQQKTQPVGNQPMADPLTVQNIPVVGVVFSAHSRTKTTWRPGEEIIIPVNNRAVLQVDSATVGFGENSFAAVVSNGNGETKIHLHQGYVVATVAKRKPGDYFVVDAGKYLVRVVGTEFSVDARKNVTIVSVAHGQVEILENHQPILQVRTGEKVSLQNDGEQLPAKLNEKELAQMKLLLSEELYEKYPDSSQKQIQLPQLIEKQVATTAIKQPEEKQSHRSQNAANYEQWKSWIMAGQHDKARKALQQHLGTAKRDIHAWWLLGNCEKRAKNWEASISAYKQVIDKGNNEEARTARFKAGVIYQEKLGKHKEAEKMFSEFVARSTSQTLTAQGLLRQAKSLLAMKQKERAYGLLKKVTAQYGDSTAAVEARQLLGQKE